MVSTPPTVVVPVPFGFEPRRDVRRRHRREQQRHDGQHHRNPCGTAPEPPAEAVERGDARRRPAISQGSQVGGGDHREREHHRDHLGQGDGVGVLRVDNICGKNREDRNHREDAAMLAQDHPSEPVPAEEEDRAQAHREIPVLCRSEPGDQRAQIVPGDNARGLARNSGHRRKCRRHDRREPEKWGGDGSAASITDVTATTIAPPPP